MDGSSSPKDGGGEGHMGPGVGRFGFGRFGLLAKGCDRVWCARVTGTEKKGQVEEVMLGEVKGAVKVGRGEEVADQRGGKERGRGQGDVQGRSRMS